MPYLKKIATPILLKILAAQASFYSDIVRPGEAADCRATMERLKQEIASRGQSIRVLDKPLYDILDSLIPAPVS